MVAPNTSPTPGGGTFIPLQLLISFFSKESKAAIACSTAGSALSKSALVSAAFALTSFSTIATIAASFCAFAVSTSTTAFSRLTTSAIPSAVSFFFSASSTMTAKSVCSFPTVAAVSLSLVKPFPNLSIPSSCKCRFCSNKPPYNFNNSKYDFGVIYTNRRSTRLNFSAKSCTTPKLNGKNFSIAALTDGSLIGTSFINFCPTANKACFGHG
mmetsp:Transcript_38162/g.49386  ORF Transcript_38162/g.49386 Transcript_38162/m.49386 type:complete len:212 (+) Transcript_38162:3003-3638(+)